MATASHSALERLLGPLADCLTFEAAQRVAAFRADAETQQRLDELADKASRGALSSDEQAEYRAFVEAIDLVSVFQAKARMRLNQASPN